MCRDLALFQPIPKKNIFTIVQTHKGTPQMNILLPSQRNILKTVHNLISKSCYDIKDNDLNDFSIIKKRIHETKLLRTILTELTK